MILRIPDYYKEFHCIAGACKHSCCQESWEIEVDKKTYEYYLGLDGEFSERLKNSIKKEEDIHFKMKRGKCPLLSSKHLCELVQTLGEGALCDVCREYPRFNTDYGNVREKALSLSCEEVGRILFEKNEPIRLIDFEVSAESIKGFPAKEAAQAMHIDEIVSARNYCMEMLQDRAYGWDERLTHFLTFSQGVQECLDSDFAENILSLIEEDRGEKKDSDVCDVSFCELHSLFQKRMDVWMGIDIEDEEWMGEMNNMVRCFHADSKQEEYEAISKQFDIYNEGKEYEYERLVTYFIHRYLIKAVFDNKFLERAKFCIFCYLSIRDMDKMRFLVNGYQFEMEDRIENARIFSKEVEHSKNTRKYLSEKIKTEDVFEMEAMLEQARGEKSLVKAYSRSIS